MVNSSSRGSLPQRRKLAAALLVCAVVGGGVATRTLLGQAPAAATTPQEFEQTVLPVLSKSCLGCHSDRVHSGNLSLEQYKNPALALQHVEVWQKVREKVNAGQMPPRTVAPLAPEARSALIAWIDKLAPPSMAGHSSESAETADPGRVTARRLNRVEYNNTIRDLLGVTLRPADEFPVDDSGYGFDNIGDVLSLSPMLMEKYMAAARNVSRAAVFGESYPEKPTLLAMIMSKKIQDDMHAKGNVAPYSIRGAIESTYHAPVEAEYEFRIRYQNFRGNENVQQDDGPARGRGAGAQGPTSAASTPDSPAPAGGAQGAAGPARGGRGRGFGPRRPPTPEELKARIEAACNAAAAVDMIFTIDGNKVYSETVRGTTDCNYARGESITRVRLTPGDHELRVSFPDYANIENPRDQLNTDGRRKLYIDFMNVVGPFSVSTAPPPSYRKIFICEPEGTAGVKKYSTACQKQIISNLMTRAYRRPPTAQELQTMMTIVNQVQRRDSFEEGVRVAIEAVLLSPNFLFRIERDQPRPQVASAAPMAAGVPTGNSYQISDFELASRLSYFLWSSMPDDELFRLAGEKKLHEPPALQAQIDRMLKDPRAASLAENFGEQWLNLRLMDRTKPDAAKFPMIDDELLGSMRQETMLFISAVMNENRSILDFIDGKFTFVNGPLARYYGIKGVDGEAFQRVELDGEQRSGILTQASILSISSYATRTSPVIRGKWVLDNLLGSAPPPPPDGIPPLIEKDLGSAASMRQRLEQHRADPSCAACHNSMDPIGFGLENYDAAGAFRTKDGNFDIDSSATLPDGRSFKGAQELKQILRADSTVFARHFTEKLMTYALGRGLEQTDRPVVEEIARSTGRDYRFDSIVSAIVQSRPFRMRTRDQGGLQ